MNDILRRQVVAGGNLCRSRRAATESGTFIQQSPASGAMDGAIHSATPQQRRIRGIDNSIDDKPCDINFLNGNAVFNHHFDQPASRMKSFFGCPAETELRLT
jgi:hypothetical protein